MTTICAIATAPGGAIGIIRVSGENAIGYVSSIFSKDITESKGYSLHYGTIKQPQSDEIIDTVLVTVFRAPHSYTGEDCVEIGCHCSAYIMQQILELLCKNGCKLAEPGEFTKRAFMNGKMDLSQAEAVADIISSQNKAQHRIAMTQMRGGITTKLHQLRNKLLELTSLLELELDFSEEDVEFADRSALLSLATDILEEIGHTVSTFQAGNAIKNGIPVAIIGAPNVGKSTLLNALLKDERAIVSDIKGTTRDVIEDTITLGGYLFRFIDTAGIRHTEDIIENMGIERSIKAAQKAQIIILLTELGVPFPDVPTNGDQTTIRITNKTENFQALHNIGIKELEQTLIDIAAKTAEGSSNDIIISNARHKEALDLAAADISRAIDSINLGISGDLIVEDLRQCLSHLSDIIGGQITSTDILNNIFSHFCIGK